jgi:hypothetical protein
LYSANIQLAADSYAFAIMDGNEYKERKREQNLNVRVDNNELKLGTCFKKAAQSSWLDPTIIYRHSLQNNNEVVIYYCLLFFNKT